MLHLPRCDLLMRGLRVHVTGSASVDCAPELLTAAHDYVRSVTQYLGNRGAGLVLGAGGEPRSGGGPPCIFDWTALEVVGALPDPAPEWPDNRQDRFVVVASQRGLEKIPDWRAELWQTCTARKDFKLEPTEPGWRMAGLIRERQVFRGDVLLALGGGAGTEHLSQLYRDEGKPVMPIHALLGAVVEDGRGGSRYLHEQALEDVNSFIALRDGAGDAAARLSQLRLSAQTDVTQLASRTVDLIGDLRPPRAFYVRLLAKDHPDFEEVERFFRETVDPVIAERGFRRHEVSLDRPEAAFINVEIFQALHRTRLAVVDLTGVRPNCMMELGYALGRQRRVLISAKKGTTLPFDEDKLPTYIWETEGTREARVDAFRNWFDRYIDLPPMVD